MKGKPDTRLVKLYAWISLVFFMIGVIDLSDTNGHRLTMVLLDNFWLVMYMAGLNYALFEHGLPWALSRKKTTGLRILCILLLAVAYLVLCTFGLYAWRVAGILTGLYTDLKVERSFQGRLENLAAYAGGSFLVFGLARHVYGFIRLRYDAQQLQIQKQEAELNFLKSQTHPHFLFNTLNNIYSLALDKSDLTAEAIVRLSQILRFILHEGRGAYIPVEKELAVISDLITLEKLRYDQSLKLDVDYDIDDPSQLIPPLLLTPLVENAFKHGVSETAEAPFIDIRIRISSHTLYMIVRNSIDAMAAEEWVTEGIGLSNLRRQLELLYGRYHLQLTRGTGYFIAELNIDLTSHDRNGMYHH